MAKIKYFFKKEFIIESLLFKYFNIKCFTNQKFKYSNLYISIQQYKQFSLSQQWK